jgi:hypothetical protein
MTKQSGQQLGKDNLLKFQSWIAERENANDWHDYLRGDKLNRSEIATECGFSLSVMRQNPAVKNALEALEARLADLGITQPLQSTLGAANEAAAASHEVIDKRIMAAKGRAEARVKELEEQNAALKAEVSSLRERLRRFEHLDDHLGRTGRLLPA